MKKIKIKKIATGEYIIPANALEVDKTYVLDFNKLTITEKIEKKTCSCERDNKVVGEYYCKQCLIENPFLCS